MAQPTKYGNITPLNAKWDTEAHRYFTRHTRRGVRVFTPCGVELALFPSELVGQTMMEGFLSLMGMQEIINAAGDSAELDTILEQRRSRKAEE